MDRIKINSELTEFMSIKHNWDGYYGITPLIDCVNNARQVIKFLSDNVIDTMIDMYPNPNGTISFEWFNDNFELLLEIGKVNMSYYFVVDETILYRSKENINVNTISEINELINKYLYGQKDRDNRNIRPIIC